jgi:hypothetical protein
MREHGRGPAQIGGEEQVIPARVETPIRFGRSAERGGYGYNILPPLDSGIGAIGVYFPQGAFGALFDPQERDEPLTYPESTEDEFIAAVLNDFGIRLGGPGFR